MRVNSEQNLSTKKNGNIFKSKNIRQPTQENSKLGLETKHLQNELKIIRGFCSKLETKIGRKLRILEIGCDHGFFTLALALDGHHLVATDQNQTNLDFINSKADFLGVANNINVHMKDSLDLEVLKEAFDVALFLGSTNYLFLNNNIDDVEIFLNRLRNSDCTIIFEIPIFERNAFWRFSLPKNYDWLLENAHFFSELGSVKKHPRGALRPLLLISDKLILIKNKIYLAPEITEIRHHSFIDSSSKRRRTFNLPGITLKYQYFTSQSENLLQKEYKNLRSMRKKFSSRNLAPKKIYYQNGYTVSELSRGTLPGERLDYGWEASDNEKILISFIDECAKWSRARLFHNDIRPWNIIWDGTRIRIIDFADAEGVDCDPSGLPQIVLLVGLANYIVQGPDKAEIFSLEELVSAYNKLIASSPITAELVLTESWINLNHVVEELKTISFTNLEEALLATTQLLFSHDFE